MSTRRSAAAAAPASRSRKSAARAPSVAAKASTKKKARATQKKKKVTKKAAAAEGESPDTDSGSDSEPQEDDEQEGDATNRAAASDAALRQELKEAKQQVQELALLLKRATAVATTATAATSVARTVEVKLRNIDSYRGEAGEPLDAWIAQVQTQYDDFVHTRGAKENHFVAQAATTLAGPVTTWWQSVPIDKRPKTWEAMQDEVRRQFQPITSNTRARQELMECQQGRQSVIVYAGRFRNLKTSAGAVFDAPEMQEFLVERFVQGLKSDEIRRDITKEGITKLDAAIERATRMEGLHGASNHRSEHVASAETTQGTSQSDAIIARLAALLDQRSTSAPPRRDNRAPYDSRRDRGANKQRTPLWTQVRGLTKEVADKRYQGNLCLFCASPSHTMRDCKDREEGKAPRLN